MTENSRQRRRPALSVVVVVYNMRREARRTLLSLAPDYQRDVDGERYEVLVVENGSDQPLDRDWVTGLGPTFRYLMLDNASPSPATAINFAVRQAQSDHVGIIIDGARMLSPGVLGLALLCLAGFDRPVIGTVGFHLGPDVHNHAKDRGYDQGVEDGLLAAIRWPDDGYRLFEIATLALSSTPRGWFGPLAESNCLFMPRSLFEELGGFEEAFDAPGGGLVNLDFWRRACGLPRSTVIHLLGEGSFHQIHGGVATSSPPEELERRSSAWIAQYQRIRGRAFDRPERTPLVVGYPHPAAVAAVPLVEEPG